MQKKKKKFFSTFQEEDKTLCIEKKLLHFSISIIARGYIYIYIFNWTFHISVSRWEDDYSSLISCPGGAKIVD